MTAKRKRLSTEAVALIYKMIDNVRKAKHTYDQGNFPTAGFGGVTGRSLLVCNTAYCSAGHLIHESSPELFQKIIRSRMPGEPFISWAGEAMKTLGLDENDERLRYVLFGASANWPSEYGNRYYRAKTPVGRFNAFKDFWMHVVAIDADIDQIGENV